MAAAAVAFLNPARAPIRARWVRELLQRITALPWVSARLPSPGWAVNLRISGDRELRRLNSQFLADDHATDVLSFPSGDDSDGFLGDIVISWQAVERQAAEFGHSPEDEVALLLVHGFLHLLGWDHSQPQEAMEMERLQRAALDAAGLSVGAGRISQG